MSPSVSKHQPDTIAQIMRYLDGRAVLRVLDYKKDTIELKESGDLHCYCPIHKDNIFRTLIISNGNKTYRCNYNFCPGNKGGDLIDLVAKARNVDYDTALADLVKSLAIPVAITTPERDLGKAFEVGRNLLDLGAFEEARETFQDILRRDPMRIDAHEGLGTACIRAGDLAAAATSFQVVMDSHRAAGRWGEALRTAQKLMGLAPAETEYIAAAIEAASHANEPQTVIDLSNQLLSLYDAQGMESESTQLRQDLEERGIVSLESSMRILSGLLWQNKIPEALEYSDRRIRGFQESGDHEATSAMLTMLIEQAAASEEQRATFLEMVNKHGISPDQLQRVLRGAELLISRQRADEAVALLDGLERRARGNVQYIDTRSMALEAAGRSDEAQAQKLALVDRLIADHQLAAAMVHVEDLLAQDLENIEALKRHIAILEADGRTDEAVDACRQLISALKTEDRTAETLALYEKLTSLDPDNAATRQEFVEALARAGRRREAALGAVMLAEDLTATYRVEEAIERLEAMSDLVGPATEVFLKLGELHLSQNDKQKAAAALRRAAQPHLDAQRWPDALAALTRASQADPTDANLLRELAETQLSANMTSDAAATLRNLAEVQLEAGHVTEAESTMTRAFDIAPEDSISLRVMAKIFASRHDERREIETLERLAELSLSKKSHARCLEVIDEILRIDPNNQRALTLRMEAYEQSEQSGAAQRSGLELADLLTSRGEREKAEPILRRLMARDGGNLPAQERLLELLLRSQRLSEAAMVGQELARSYKRLNRREQARQLAMRLVDVAPREDGPRKLLLELEVETSNTSAAVDQARSLIALYREQDRPAEATDQYRLLAKLLPNDLDVRGGLVDGMIAMKAPGTEIAPLALSLARALKDGGRGEEARKRYRQVIDMDRQNEAAQMELATLERDLGHDAEAVALLTPLIDRVRDRGDLATAIALSRQALGWDPTNASLRRIIVDLHLDDHEIDQAIAGYIDLIDVYRRDNQRSKALQTIEEAIGVKPDHLRLRELKVDELRALGRTLEADRAELDLVEMLAGRGDHPRVDAMLEAMNSRSAPPAGLEATRRRLNRLKDSNADSGAGSAPVSNSDTGRSRPAPPSSTPTAPGSDGVPGSDSRTRRAAQMAASYKAKSGGDYRRTGPDKAPVTLAFVESYTFENFVVGDENQFGHAVAMAISKNPGQQYNPVFFHGPVGVGKTHLLNAVAHAVAKNDPEVTITYTSTEEFISQLVEAIQTNRVTAFRNTYRSTDILLVDDIQFLAEKERAQEEFFHVFTALFQSGRQIILTSDRPPKELKQLEERLTSRFGAGVIIELKRPGIETRMAIVRKELERAQLTLDPELIEFVAATFGHNAREVKGAVNQISILAGTLGASPTIEQARDALQHHNQTQH